MRLIATIGLALLGVTLAAPAQELPLFLQKTIPLPSANDKDKAETASPAADTKEKSDSATKEPDKKNSDSKSAEPTTKTETKANENWLVEFMKPTMRIRGLIETEAIVAAQSARSKAVLGDLENGYGFRRARLGATGTIGDGVRWISEIDVAGQNLQFVDCFIALTAIPGVQALRIGYFREPFSLEGSTSATFITFTERSSLNEIDPARNWGVAGYWWPENERFLYVLGAFRDGTSRGGISRGDQDCWAYTTRLCGLPYYVDDPHCPQLIQLGVAASYRKPFDGLVVYHPPGGSTISLLTVQDNPDTPYLPSVVIPANSQQLYNLQMAYQYGPFCIQNELFANCIQQTNAGVVLAGGGYTYISYFLTGEFRGYDKTRGAFSQINVLHPVIKTHDKPGGGWGAFEATARYSYYNFSSANIPPNEDGISPRANLNQMELGMNWYWNNYTRLMFNYTAPFPDIIERGATAANVFTLRAEVYW